MRFVSIAAGLSLLVVACNQSPDPVREAPALAAVESTGTVQQADSSGSFIGLVPIADDVDNGSARWAGAGGPLWVGYSGQCSTVGSRFRGMNVKFSVPGLPACATITSASLTFRYTGCISCQSGADMTVLRIGTAWSESTDTGNCAFPVNANVGAVGGLVQTAPAVFAPGLTGGVATATFNVAADVQAWVNGSANNGWQLRFNGAPGFPGCPGTQSNWGCPATGCGGNKKHVYTRENGANSPTLNVFYTLSDANCNDGKPCTEDACTSGGCTHAPNNALTCSDGKACTTDSCSGGNCVWTPVNAACDDLNVCTNDVCSPASAGANGAGCIYTNNTNNCTDPAACTQNDKCAGGVCAGTPNNTLCDDTNNCTSDTCTASGCQNVITMPGCQTCANDNQCPTGKYCNGLTCIPASTNGTQCTVSNHCASGVCKDGVCCDKACNGQCEACNVSGSVGVCKAVSGAPIAPRGACTSDATVCGGTCNGTVTATCTYPGTVTRCRAPSCTANVGTLAAACNGTGKCPAVQTQPCTPFVCGPTQCVGTCTTNAECQAGRYCAAGMCIPLVDAGKACTADGQCKSAICVDKVCCNSRCNEQCEACDVEGKEGTCSAVPDGVPHGNRPKCITDDGKGNGVCDGTCDGTSRDACVYPGPGVQCSDPSCDKGTATVASYCQGTGKCPEPERVDCGNDCVGDLCGTDCTTDAVCSINEFCLAGKCVKQHGNGEKCNSPTACASSFCVDGVCCDDSCNGQCQACDVAGSAGTCVAAKGSPRGVRPACASIDPECAGTCDGVKGNSCTYPDSGKVCTPASCATGVAKLVRTCAGNGECGPIQEQLCAPQVCSGTRCGGGCTVDATCGAGKFCSGGVCVAKFLPGSSCGNDAQCATGFCTDSVCCDQECGEQCQACNDPSSVGHCVPVVGRPHGGRAPCIGTASCAGQCDGKDIRQCVLPSMLTECGKAVCAAGVSHDAPVCNGAGTCIAGTGTDCYPFGCSPDEKTCATSCNGSADCAPGLLCDNGGCVPGPDAGLGPDGGAGTSGGKGGTNGGGASSAAGNAGQGRGGSAGVSGSGPMGTGGDFAGADGGEVDGGAKPPQKSGDTGACGCRVAERSTGRRDALGALALGALLVLRRRPRRRFG